MGELKEFIRELIEVLRDIVNENREELAALKLDNDALRTQVAELEQKPNVHVDNRFR